MHLRNWANTAHLDKYSTVTVFTYVFYIKTSIKNTSKSLKPTKFTLEFVLRLETDCININDLLVVWLWSISTKGMIDHVCDILN